MTEIFSYFSSFGALETVLLLVGIALMIVEMFIPGFGIAGISGLVCLVFGVVLKANSVGEALLLILSLILVLGVMFVLIIRSAKKGRLSKSAFVLKSAATREEGFSSSDEMTYYVGREGIAQTALRPAGVAVFEGVRLDVVSQGEFIEPGTKVKVVHVEGRRIVVASADEASSHNADEESAV